LKRTLALIVITKTHLLRLLDSCISFVSIPPSDTCDSLRTVLPLILCCRTPFCLRYLYSLYHPRRVPGSHKIEGYVYFILLLKTSKRKQRGNQKTLQYEHYTLCVLPKARATASYTPRNSLIRESSGSAASPRVCSGDGSGGLSGTFSNPNSPTLAPC
jgi:hypothetical protein